MTELKETGLLEGLAPPVAALPWVKVLDKVYRERQRKLLDLIAKLNIYTDIDNVDEKTLDILAIQRKVDWYDQSYPIETKRRIIKTALQIRRFYGTDWATETALQSVYPGSKIVQWYDYGGTPGHFYVECEISDSQGQPRWQEIERIVGIYKRETAHLDFVNFKVVAKTDAVCYVAAKSAGVSAKVTVVIQDVIGPKTASAEAYSGVKVVGSLTRISAELKNGEVV